MSENNFKKEITILDQTYPIAFAAGEEEKLDSAAKFLNEQLTTMSNQGQMKKDVRLLAVTSLNLAHQLMECRHSLRDQEQQLNKRIRGLSNAIRRQSSSHTPLKKFGASL